MDPNNLENILEATGLTATLFGIGLATSVISTWAVTHFGSQYFAYRRAMVQYRAGELAEKPRFRDFSGTWVYSCEQNKKDDDVK